MPLILGQWNVVCDRCGTYQKSGDVTKTWDGLIVCKPEIKRGCFEPRHPQDFVRAVKDDQSVPFTRPDPGDRFVDVTFNCDVMEMVPFTGSNHITVDTTVYKNYISGPFIVESGTVTVVCTLEVR